MLYYGTDPESYITEHTLVYEDIVLKEISHKRRVTLHVSPSKK